MEKDRRDDPQKALDASMEKLEQAVGLKAQAEAIAGKLVKRREENHFGELIRKALGL